jgi:hypothetical protein
MTVYVDPLMDHGWVIRGRDVKSCHMFTNELDLEDLHRIAAMIGCKRTWFQGDKAIPHYDLTLIRRQEAIACGAIAVTRREAVEIWRRRRAAVDEIIALHLKGIREGTA